MKALLILFLALFLGITIVAQAKPPFERKTVHPSPTQQQAQNQVQNQNQSQIASGGSVSNISTESQVFAFSGNITQVQVSDCFVPARRFGRSQNYLWGLFSISALSTLDKDCVEAKVRILEAQARLLEAQNEAERRRLSACREHCSVVK